MRLTYPDRVVLEQIFDKLKEYEERIDEDFKNQNRRWPQPSDKITKVVEELGEVQQSRKNGGTKDKVLDEIWDSTIASLGLALLLQYPSGQIIDGFERLLQKLDARWGKNGSGHGVQPT